MTPPFLGRQRNHASAYRTFRYSETRSKWLQPVGIFFTFAVLASVTAASAVAE
jgi:hypothetical protein